MGIHPTAPPIPPSGHKSHRNKLTVRPESFRILETIHPISSDFFIESARQFMDENIPAFPSDFAECMTAEITVPCSPDFAVVSSTPLIPAQTTEIVAHWVYMFALHTAQRIVEHAFGECLDARPESLQTDGTDKPIFVPIPWGLRFPDVSSDSEAVGSTRSYSSESSRDSFAYDDDDNVPVTVFVQPPWVLSEKDLEMFVACPTIPRVRDEYMHEPIFRFNSQQRLWAKVFDECYRRNSRYFVITSYEGWVFGWTTGYTSQVFSRRSMAPTILELLAYWLSSALGKPGGFQIPEVPEPVEYHLPENKVLIPVPVRSGSVASSASEWDDGTGRCDSFSESNGSDDDAATIREDDGENATIYAASQPALPSFMQARPTGPIARIARWRKNTCPSFGDGTDGTADRRLVQTDSQLSFTTQSSGSVVLDYSLTNRREGAWLSYDPSKSNKQSETV
ncbi:uncharacterized protein FIBRA_07344 [Fibroporia radiculosa]|uniref:Uncharacterized protein n=1 Tax=Fibroporia radiculosa TaxID=599839 RepID=J4IBR8_9APHY|nr:uncharacterized protein FIBRA_07344 [Fibroporia radiculosa]CCM05136.1 predicted protein [Fibroporia radiculosa]